MAKAKKTAAKKAAPTTKSIISADYRKAMMERDPDWLREQINAVARPPVSKEVKDGDKMKTIKVPGEIDVKALFGLAKENGLDVSKFKAQEGSTGFAARMSMTIRNMLQGVARARHGVVIGGTFKKAPADWLKEKNAPDEPTHSKTGEKIAKKKAKAA